VSDASPRTAIWVRSAIEVGYVATVAILAIIATADPNNKVDWAWTATLVLCLPSLITLLPVLYLAVSKAFNMTGADAGGITWPVTAAYVTVFTLMAVMNVWLVSLAIKSHERKRNAETPAR